MHGTILCTESFSYNSNWSYIRSKLKGDCIFTAVLNTKYQIRFLFPKSLTFDVVRKTVSQFWDLSWKEFICPYIYGLIQDHIGTRGLWVSLCHIKSRSSSSDIIINMEIIPRHPAQTAQLSLLYLSNIRIWNLFLYLR
jgi:hypothetical protein